MHQMLRRLREEFFEYNLRQMNGIERTKRTAAFELLERRINGVVFGLKLDVLLVSAKSQNIDSRTEWHSQKKWGSLEIVLILWF